MLILPVVLVSASALSAAFSYKWKRDAAACFTQSKIMADFSYQSKVIATNQATGAAESLKSCSDLLIKSYGVLEESKTCRDNVSELGKYALKSATDSAMESSRYADESKGYSFSSEGHSAVSKKHAERSEILNNGFSDSIVDTLEKLRESEIRTLYLVEDAARHSEDSKAHAERSDEYAAQSFRHREEAVVLANLAEEHAMSAAKHVASAGTLSAAVTKAAQSAAQKTQTQAQCKCCERAVNSYSLRENGDVVCKHCSDRGK